MLMNLLRKNGIGVGAVFLLGLLLVGVMMCSITFFVLSEGQLLFVKGCDQVLLMMNYVMVDRVQELLVTIVLLSVIVMLGVVWRLSDTLNGFDRVLWNKEGQFLVRVAVDPILQSFRQGIIRNLSYN